MQYDRRASCSSGNMKQMRTERRLQTNLYGIYVITFPPIPLKQKISSVGSRGWGCNSKILIRFVKITRVTLAKTGRFGLTDPPASFPPVSGRFEAGKIRRRIQCAEIFSHNLAQQVLATDSSNTVEPQLGWGLKVFATSGATVG